MVNLLRICLTGLLCVAIQAPASGARLKLDERTADPFVSALVIDAETGVPLSASDALEPVYPASLVKLMVLYIVLEQVEQGAVRLGDTVTASEEAYRMGGSQIYLDVGEQFSIDELLYALIIQSANDAAVALAEHLSGSKDAFVQLMNLKATELGMRDTRFASVHGLPPEVGQQPDETTARDVARLCRALLQKPGVLRYTAKQEYPIRDGAFIMRSHNPLLRDLPGCDGLKTGYFRAAGFSIAATAERDGRRLIAVVLGSASKQARNRAAARLIEDGFRQLEP